MLCQDTEVNANKPWLNSSQYRYRYRYSLFAIKNTYLCDHNDIYNDTMWQETPFKSST